VIRELSQIEPEFLALFGFESLLCIEGAKKATLGVIKVYLDKREYNLEKSILVVD